MPRALVLASVLLLLVVAGCGGGGSGSPPPPAGPGEQPVAPGDIDKTAIVDGRSRTWRVHVPPGVVRGHPVPVVYVLHGGFGTGVQVQQLYGFDAFADARGCVVVYPDGYQKSWNDGRGGTPALEAGIDDLAFFDAMDAELRAWVDPDQRLFVCGMSNGAEMSHRLAAERSARFAAIGAVCGNVSEAIAALPAPATAVSAVLVLGTADPRQPWAGGAPIAGRGQVLSATASFDLYRARAATADPVTALLPDLVPSDGATATRLASTSGEGGRAVELYRIDGGGHCWPGHPGVLDIGANCADIDVTAVLVDFLLAHPRPAPRG